jgi:uncharacterized protein YukE
VTKAYKKSRPWAEIPDAACLQEGCHQTRLLDGEIRFKNVKFDHKDHLTTLRRGKRLRCTSCHSQIVQGEHITVTESTCFICHFKSSGGVVSTIDDCKICHKPEYFLERPNKFRYDHSSVIDKDLGCTKCHVEVIVGDGAVAKEKCFSCHWEIDRLSRFDEHDFLHKVHITENKIECLQCHTEIQHKVTKKNSITGSDCQACHENTHEAQQDLFFAKKGYAPERPPNIMHEAGLSCKSCHIFHQESMKGINEVTYIGKPKSCEICHGKGFSRLYQQWNDYAQVHLDHVDNVYNIIEKHISEIQVQESEKEQIQQLMNQAQENIQLVKQGKGIHNIQFVDILLKTAVEKIQQAASIAGLKDKIPDFKSGERFIPGECSSCHIGIADISVTVYGVQYSHEKHLKQEGLSCKKCHSNAKIHGELILKRNDCLNCHHTRKDKECTDCHQKQVSILEGRVLEHKMDGADFMWEAGLDCKSCHWDDMNERVGKNINKCTICHDESYVDILNGWEQEADTLIRNLEQIINELKQSQESNPMLEDIIKQFEFIKSEKSNGAHNPVNYTSYLLKLKSDISKLTE